MRSLTTTLTNHSPGMDPLPRSGDLGEVDVVQLLRTLHRRQSTGILRLESARSGHRNIFYISGDLVAARSDVEDLRLGRILYRAGHLRRAQLEEALQATTPERPLGEIFVAKGLITPELRQKLLAEQFREIVFSSLLLREGTYLWTPEDAIFADNLQLFHNTEALIDEGVKVLEETAILSRALEQEDHIYQRVGVKPSLPLARDQEELLRVIDGRRSTAELFVLSPLERLPTIQLLCQLLEQGLIRKVSAVPRRSPEAMPGYPLLAEELEGATVSTDRDSGTGPRSLDEAGQRLSDYTGSGAEDLSDEVPETLTDEVQVGGPGGVAAQDIVDAEAGAIPPARDDLQTVEDATAGVGADVHPAAGATSPDEGPSLLERETVASLEAALSTITRSQTAADLAAERRASTAEPDEAVHGDAREALDALQESHGEALAGADESYPDETAGGMYEESETHPEDRPVRQPFGRRPSHPNEGVFLSTDSVLDVVDLSHIRQYGIAVEIPLDGIVEAAGAEDDEHHMASLAAEAHEDEEDLEEHDGEEDLEEHEGDEDLEEHEFTSPEELDEHELEAHEELGEEALEEDEAFRSPQERVYHELSTHQLFSGQEEHEVYTLGTHSDDDSIAGLEAALDESLHPDDRDLDNFHAESEEGFDEGWGPTESLLEDTAGHELPEDALDEEEVEDYEPLPLTSIIDAPPPQLAGEEEFEELRPEDLAALQAQEEEPLALEEALFPSQPTRWEPPPPRDDLGGEGEDEVQELGADAVLEPHDDGDEFDDVLAETVSIRPGDPLLRQLSEEPLLPPVRPATRREAASGEEISKEDMAVLEKIVAIFQPRDEEADGSGTRRGARAERSRTGASAQLSTRQRALLRERAEVYNQIFSLVFTQFTRKLGRERTRQHFQDFFNPGNTTYPELFNELSFKGDGTLDADQIVQNLEAYPTQRPAEVFDASLNELFYFLLRDIHQILDPAEQAQMMDSVLQIRNLLFKKNAAAR